MSKQRDNRPSKLWPVGSAVQFLDAYGFNPVNGKVIAHYSIETNILVEDTRGVRHFGETWRVTSAPPADRLSGMFDDLFGDEPPKPKGMFEDLLG